MPSLKEATYSYRSAALSMGRSVLSSLYPLTFEFYLIAFELVDSSNRTAMYMTFPIMPDNIQENYPARLSINNTMGGTYVVTNRSFSPRNISLRGSFGRGFKITADSLIGTQNLYDFNVWKRSYQGSSASPIFAQGLNTGYGSIKNLQMLIEESLTLDNFGKPYKLYFYNMALNENYVVVPSPQGVVLTQDMSKNMVWSYSLNLTAISPLSNVNKFNNTMLAIPQILGDLTSNTLQQLASLA